jgi:hypothetical protein
MSSKRPQTKGKNGNQKNKTQLQARNPLREARIYEEKKAEAEAAAVAEAAAGAEAGAKDNVDFEMAEKELEESISEITNDLIEGNPIDNQKLVSIMKVMFAALFGNGSRRNLNKILKKLKKKSKKLKKKLKKK